MKKDSLLTIGQRASEISLKNQNEELINLKDYSKKWIVLYFYPKDNTPG